jgi:hypothetical protein
VLEEAQGAYGDILEGRQRQRGPHCEAREMSGAGETILHLVCADGSEFGKFAYPQTWLAGLLPRTLVFNTMVFAYERPIGRYDDGEHHQYRRTYPIDLARARKLP